MKNLILFLPGLFFFASSLFADAAIYVTNQNDEDIQYTLVIPPTLSVDGNPSGDVPATVDGRRLLSVSDDGMDDASKELVEMKFHNGSGKFICSVRFPYETSSFNDYPPASANTLANCSVDPADDGFTVTVSKPTVQADYS